MSLAALARLAAALSENRSIAAELAVTRAGLAVTVEKTRRKVYAFCFRDLPYRPAVAPRNTVRLPHDDRAAIDGYPDHLAHQCLKCCRAAELVDKLGVVHGDQILQRNFVLSIPEMLKEESRDLTVPVRQILRMGSNQPTEVGAGYKAAVGRRLKLTRLALDYRYVREFANLTGIGEANLSNWERGISLVPAEYVQKLKRLFQITHDWVYGGDPSGLRRELRDKLLEAERDSDTDRE